MQLSRRDLVKLGVVVGTAVGVKPASAAYSSYNSDPGMAVPPPFRQQLRQPPTLQPVRSDSTADYYEVTSGRTTATILPGVSTPVSAYNGSYLGPTLRVRSGRATVVRHTNGLTVPTSVHTHGSYVDGDSDGHPSNLIAPGASKTYLFGNDQNARTQWYHDHAEHYTATNVYAGLSGFYLISDAFEDALPLPKGEYDVPLCLQDRTFNADGTLNYTQDAVSNDGLMGQVLVVNGVAQPFFPVASRRYRLRFLNGANARPFLLQLSNGMSFQLIATEGGLIDAPVTLTSLPIWPAERYEVVVDFGKVPVGTSVVLQNGYGSTSATSQLMRFDVVRSAVDDSTVPAVLRPAADQVDATHMPTTEAAATVTRRWDFGKTWDSVYVINGKTYDKNRVDALPRPGDTEIWELTTGYGWSHPVHIHLLNFTVLDRGGRAPFAHEAGFWKETVLLRPNEKVRLLMKWPTVPTPPVVLGGPGPGDFTSRYAFHCHNLGHEDHDMMTQFRVQP